MRILVIDDNATNRAAAVAQLGGHETTVVGSYESAKELLEKGGFDVVLTDLFMPAEKSRMYGSRRCEYPEGLVLPFGMFIAVKAMSVSGVKFVGVLSNDNHHDNALSEFFSDDLCYYAKRIETSSGTKMFLGSGSAGSSDGYIQAFPPTGDLSTPYDRAIVSAIATKDRSEYDKIIFTKNWKQFLVDLIGDTEISGGDADINKI